MSDAQDDRLLGIHEHNLFFVRDGRDEDKCCVCVPEFADNIFQALELTRRLDMQRPIVRKCISTECRPLLKFVELTPEDIEEEKRKFLQLRAPLPGEQEIVEEILNSVVQKHDLGEARIAQALMQALLSVFADTAAKHPSLPVTEAARQQALTYLRNK